MSTEQSASSSPLRIALLAHHLRVAGGAVVGKNLLKAICAFAPEHHYLITIPDDDDYHRICSEFPNCQTIVFRPKGGAIGRIRYEQTVIANAVREFGPDLLLGMGGIGLDDPPCKQALLVQDSHYFYPAKQYFMESAGRKLVKAYHKRKLSKQLRRTDLLLCQTAVALKRCVETFSFKGATGICPNAVTRLADDAETAPMPAALEQIKDKFRLFYLTKYYPHKNLEGIVETFDRYRDELRDCAVVLTVAPEHHSRAAGFIESIAKRGLEKSVVNVGPLPYSQIGSYYRHIQGLLMPTYLESFSGTYLEAMHFGVPILTSDLDFARGICGDAALYFDQTNPGAMRDAIVKLRDNPALAKSLVEKGRQHLASMYTSWDEIGRKLMALLIELVGRPSSEAAHRSKAAPEAATSAIR